MVNNNSEEITAIKVFVWSPEDFLATMLPSSTGCICLYSVLYNSYIVVCIFIHLRKMKNVDEQQLKKQKFYSIFID